MSLAVIAALLLSAQQPLDPVTGAAPPDLIEWITARAIEVARSGAGGARLPDGSLLPVQTAEDRQRFAVPEPLERQTVRRGLLTGQLEYCEIDGIRRSFGPYMDRLRASRRYSEYQLAYLAVLHGVSQQMIMGAMESAREPICSDSFAAGLVAAADAEPILIP